MGVRRSATGSCSLRPGPRVCFSFSAILLPTVELFAGSQYSLWARSLQPRRPQACLLAARDVILSPMRRLSEKLLLVGQTLLSALLVTALLALPAAAEEFYLKDGTKLVGKIVAYEKDSFRVETSFGIAIIYKDRIERIVFEPGSKEAAAKAGPAPPPPVRIVEYVSGTRYVNETFRFQMFKPPTWRSYPQLVRPGGPLVAALGTPDETTLMLVGRENFNGDLTGYARLAENALQRTYADYRKQNERRTTVAGLPAFERDFTGEAEGRFWTGTALYFARGRDYFTILSLTAAGDTTNFQQTLLRKVVDTLEFLPE